MCHGRSWSFFGRATVRFVRARDLHGAWTANLPMPELEAAAPLLRVVLRLLCAVLLGGLIGWDRERREKPAGLRTHMMVTLGSAAFVLLALDVTSEVTSRYGSNMVDPTRVLQGVVGGIGFLGAGCIIQSRGHVKGVTTAASLWVAGALGAACGMGAHVLAAVTAGLALVILSVIGRFERQTPKPADPHVDTPAERPSKLALRNPPPA
jgi:putative Mg2+ transporter-C (MgtC) family protein